MRDRDREVREVVDGRCDGVPGIISESASDIVRVLVLGIGVSVSRVVLGIGVSVWRVVLGIGESAVERREGRLDVTLLGCNKISSGFSS